MQAPKKYVLRLIFIFAILFALSSAQASTLVVDQGKPVTIGVNATGTAPFTYQWRKDGISLPGATGATLYIAAATALNAGAYTVVVSNSAGSDMSDQAILTVNTLAVALAPTITTQPLSAGVMEGNASTFTVAASGTSLNFQWLKNGAAISGATNSSYKIAATSLNDAGTYSVVVSNSAGSVNSALALLTVSTLTVALAPTITTQPMSAAVMDGNSSTFSVAASGTSLNFQWLKNGVAISGATNSSYKIAATSLGDAGTYSVVVSNSAGSVTSALALLTVNTLTVAVAPTITTQPLSAAVMEGNSSTFSVVASGTALSYQWLKNGTSIPGAIGTSYTIPVTALSDAGSYSVYIYNNLGWASSNNAVLTVSSALGFAEVTPVSYTARGSNSSAQGVAMLFDGKNTTKWVDNSATTWVMITCAAPTALDAYSLTSAGDAPTRDPASWTLLGSNDGITWNVIDTRSSQSWATRQLTRDFVLSKTSAPYTQFRFDFTTTSDAVTQLAEIELYGSTVVSTKLATPSYSARGQASTSCAISKLFDGNATTRWVDYDANSWVMLDMKSATTLHRYTLTSSSDVSSSDPIGWTLYGSNDGINWAVIETRTGQSWSSRKLKRDFTLTTPSNKYVWFRFNFQLVSSSNTTRLAEMELFGAQ